MPNYRLLPIDPDHTAWDRSTYKGEVHARAQSEKQARQLADGHFSVMARVDSTQGTIFSPWTDAGIVSCETMDNEDRDNEPPAILFPKES